MHKNAKTREQNVGTLEAQAESFSKLTTDKFGMTNNAAEYYIPGWMKRTGVPASEFSNNKEVVTEAFSDLQQYLEQQ